MVEHFFSKIAHLSEAEFTKAHRRHFRVASRGAHIAYLTATGMDWVSIHSFAALAVLGFVLLDLWLHFGAE